MNMPHKSRSDGFVRNIHNHNEEIVTDGNLTLRYDLHSESTDDGASSMRSVGDGAKIKADGKIWFDHEKMLEYDRKYWILRRGQDIFLSLIALLVLAIPMLIVALVIWIDSPGASPIFTQDRVGKDGKLFKFKKFRSMVPNAEQSMHELLHKNEMDGPVFKIKDDPRITRVGRFIRKTSIDELPQLFNVLKGDMSLIGPRPALPREVAQYNDYERQRLYVTPGLTCYWQIQPRRNELSFEEWLKLDLKYIQDRSFWVDWKIILKTFGAVLGMNGE